MPEEYNRRFEYFKKLGLSTRASHRLAIEKFDTIQQVNQSSDVELLMIPNIGFLTLKEIRSVADKPGFLQISYHQTIIDRIQFHCDEIVRLTKKLTSI